MKIEWKTENHLIPYPDALSTMEERVEGIVGGQEGELVWLLEHPSLYTAGTSAKQSDLLEARFPVYDTGRGGEYTYHGPGQRVAYVMLNLEQRDMKDLRLYIAKLEQWIIEALALLGVKGGRRDGRIGIWVDMDDPFTHASQKNTDATASAPIRAAFPPEGETRQARSFHGQQEMTCPTEKEKKIAAIGVRVRKWVTFHGVSINVNPDLSHFEGIVPCGIREYGVTSLAELLPDVVMEDLDNALKKAWRGVF